MDNYETVNLINNNMFKDLLREIKWAYQRVIRGFDDTIYWELDSYMDKFIDPIETFCNNELKTDYADINPKRTEIFKETLKRIKAYKDMDYSNSSSLQDPNERTLLWEYIGKNINNYWS